MLQVEILQVDRVKTVMENMEAVEQPDEWKETELSRNWLVALHVSSPGLKLEEAVDAVAMLDGMTFFSCSRDGQAYNMVFQTEMQSWQNVKKAVIQALKPLEKLLPESHHTEPDHIAALEVARLELSVGGNLWVTAAEMLPAVAKLRVTIAGDLGFVFPPLHIDENANLNPNQYEIKVEGKIVGAGEVWPNEKLALHAESFPHGTLVKEPVYETDARWITAEHEAAATAAGLTVVTAENVFITHLAEAVKTHAAELLRRQQVYFLIEKAAEHCRAVIAEVIPAKIQIHDLHRLLQGLLSNGKSIKDLERIFEAIGSCDTKQLHLILVHVLATVYS